MCSRDHEPIGTMGGRPYVVCDDVPTAFGSWVLPAELLGIEEPACS